MNKFICCANHPPGGNGQPIACVGMEAMKMLAFRWKGHGKSPPVNVWGADSLVERYSQGKAPTRLGFVLACPEHLPMARLRAARLSNRGLVEETAVRACPACAGWGQGENRRGATPDGGCWISPECPACAGRGNIPDSPPVQRPDVMDEALVTETEVRFSRPLTDEEREAVLAWIKDDGLLELVEAE